MTLADGVEYPDKVGIRCYEPHPELLVEKSKEKIHCIRPEKHEGRHEAVKGGEWVWWVG